MKTTVFPKQRHGLSCCSEKPPLSQRELLGADSAGKLADVFDVLANDTRLRLLHVLVREREASPSALARHLDMTPQAVCNQLQRLSDRRIVETRRNGNNVLYRIIDPCVIDLIDRGLCLLEDSVERQRMASAVKPARRRTQS